MGYPSEWQGSKNPEDTSGVAKFKLDDTEYSLRLDSFASYQILSDMLGVAFAQGKRFAANAMRVHIHNAMEKARIDHAL